MRSIRRVDRASDLPRYGTARTPVTPPFSFGPLIPFEINDQPTRSRRPRTLTGGGRSIHGGEVHVSRDRIPTPCSMRIFFLMPTSISSLTRWRRLSKARWTLALAASTMIPAACGDQSTSQLASDLEQRFAEEGITRRGADLNFRFTRGAGGRSERWENRRASIVVTRSSVFIHKNEKIGLEITPRTQKAVGVERSGSRVRIRSGSGRSEEIWSFEAPDDAPGWTTDIRAVTRQSKGGSGR